MEIWFILRIHFLVFYLFFSYPPASEGGITVMIVLCTCSQAAICNPQMCCPINVVTCCLRCLTKLLAEGKVLQFILYYPVEDH